MKEIGLKLKLKREANGVSIEEAAEDLNVKEKELKSIEEGNKDNFKDILVLKSMIKDYAKYLGLDGEEILDNFNEVLFEQTSRISLEEIEEAKKEKEIREKDLKVLSPYTKKSKKLQKKYFIILGIIILIIILLLLIIGIIMIKK